MHSLLVMREHLVFLCLVVPRIWMTTQVSASNDFLYQVTDDNSQHVVDLHLMTCTCNHFQVDGVACQYGLVVIGEIGEQLYRYCSRYHTKDS